MRLDVNDPRVVADVGRDVGYRRQHGRRVDGRGGLGRGGQAEDGGDQPASGDGGKSDFFIVVPSSFCLLLCSSRGATVAVRTLWTGGDGSLFADLTY